MNERGITLVEVILACAIGLVVMAGAVSVLTAAQRRSTTVERRTDATLRARAAVETAQRSLRAQACLQRDTDAPLPPIAGATATAVTFYADLAAAGTPTLRKLELSGGALSETAWPNAAGTGTPFVRRLATGLQPIDSTTPVFSYFAYNTATPPQPTLRLTPGSSGLSATDRARVASIAIQLAAAPANVAAQSAPKPVELRDSVLVRLTDPDGSVVPLCV